MSHVAHGSSLVDLDIVCGTFLVIALLTACLNLPLFSCTLLEYGSVERNSVWKSDMSDLS